MAKKRKQKPIGKKEFLFNVFSYLVIIGIAIVIGYRSIYYYSKQNNTAKREASTLKAALINNNKVTTSSNGFHQDREGYYFKGVVDTNYVSMFNRVFRVVRINDDSSIRLVNNSNEGLLIWGDKTDYASSNINNWLNKTNISSSGVYYNTMADVSKFLTKKSYCDGTLTNKKVLCKEKTMSDYFSILSVSDYVMAGGKNSFLFNKQASWLLGHDNENSNLYIDTDGTVEKATNYEGKGIRVTLTLKKNTKITAGSGSLNDPYIIDQQGSDTLINKYVKLGNDIYKIYGNESGNLRLALTKYLQVKDKDYELYFSKKIGYFNPLNNYNIAYFLNKTYYNSLSYKAYLNECNFKIGDVSSTTSTTALSNEKETINNKVGLLNMYDYNSINNLDDFYLINTMNKKSDMVYVYNKNGILEEDNIDEEKKIVPVVCLDKTIIKSGDGSINNPYVVE